MNYEIFFSDLENTLFRIINENFIKEKRRKYIDLASILMDYLVKSKSFVGRSDLLGWIRGMGYKSADYREFVNSLKPWQEVIYELAG